MRVFLTGGTGLLGSHLAERLQAGGMEVGALHRPGADTRFLASLGCILVPGHLEDSPEEHARRMTGCGSLFHAAGRLYGASSMAEARRANVEGTRRILEGAVRAGVKRAVYVSSVAVYGNQKGEITEESPPTGTLLSRDFYGHSKREAEELALGFQGQGGMQVTVLRPSALWGERDRHFLPRLVRWLGRAVCPLPGGGRTPLPIVYAGNLAVAAQTALSGAGNGGVFNLGEDVPVTLRALAEGLAGELGLAPRFWNVPEGLVTLAARIAQGLGIRIPGAGDLAPVRAARLALGGNPYSTEKARRELGWTPPFTLEVAVRRVGDWIRSGEAWTKGRIHEC